MKLSVALCSYNGSKYLYEQLESIINQSMLINEIVVCDDGSTDDTLQIIDSFQTKKNTIIKVYHNAENLGPSLNFQKAINLCTGDIVFLSDQDDIWKEHKVQVVVGWFNENPSKSVVFSDADLIDEDGNLISEQSLWDCIGFTEKAQQALHDGFGVELFCYENRATGATMAIRRNYIKNLRFVDVCNDTILHDGALAMIALADNSLGFISEKLTLYRCHGSQSVGIGTTIKEPLSDDPRETSYLAELWAKQKLPTIIKQRVHFIAKRYRIIGQRSGFFKILKNLHQYKHFYSNHWKEYFSFDINHWRNHFFKK